MILAPKKYYNLSGLRIKTPSAYIGRNESPVMHRLWAMPNRYTFKMKVAQNILASHGVGAQWVDPFAGYHSPAEHTNDLDTNAPTSRHMDAVAFMKMFTSESVAGVLLDPPYSLHQVTVSYEGRGAKRVIALTPVYDQAARICRVGGKVLSWGWNTNGVGKKRGFELVEVYVIAHGGHHNDTLVTVEVKRHNV